MDDWQLLKSYGRDDSQDAFTEIVRRHVNLVYSAALRQAREAELARDVTQLVFANLARRAKSLSPKGTLAGWLYCDASLTSREILRRERRRVAREQDAISMQDERAQMPHDWSLIRPGLDAALSQLGQTDRDAVLLRFFEQRSLKEVGSALGMAEDTARKRVSRALEKLRMQLTRQGVTTTDDALSGALTTHAVQVAPAGIVAGVVAASVAAASASTVTGTTAFIEFLTMTTKLKATVAGVALLACVGTPLFVQHQENESLRARNQALVAQASQFAALEEENQRLSNRVALSANGTALSEQERIELNRLRGEVATLRGEAKQAQQLRAEINRLRSGGRAVPSESPATTEALASYLGEAVPPPADIDAAYSREGLLNNIQQAAQLAGVSLKKLEIETSEFPFLAGVVCDSDADFEKLKAQFKSMPNYEWGASAGGRGTCAFNITPLRSFSSEERTRIVRRTLLRTGLFSDQLAAR